MPINGAWRYEHVTGGQGKTRHQQNTGASSKVARSPALCTMSCDPPPSSITKPGMLSSGVWLILVSQRPPPTPHTHTHTTPHTQFYTPWCTHSEDALPHFVAAVQHIVDHNITQLSIGKIDISKAPGIYAHSLHTVHTLTPHTSHRTRAAVEHTDHPHHITVSIPPV